MAKQNKLHIKKGDTVRIISGSGKGTEGRVMKVFPQKMTAIVEGKKIVKKHMRPSQQYPDGGIIEQEAPIHVSNLMLIDPVTKEPTRIGRKKVEGGKGWVRYAKKSGEELK
ncbi:MAG: 50S ribosomal protein L24 [Bacteroidetes bacterium]|nr:50S ribosomal protein L24 [Bacteroidota bacterium]MCB0841707.1 50S ribosomal protein L24 [Bacteroidota bacterium]